MAATTGTSAISALRKSSSSKALSLPGDASLRTAVQTLCGDYAYYTQQQHLARSCASVIGQRLKATPVHESVQKTHRKQCVAMPDKKSRLVNLGIIKLYM